MRKSLLNILIVFVGTTLFGESSHIQKEGVVQYISSQYIYVNFEDTEGIEIGDTLYTPKLNPKLIVSSLSSRSVASTIISGKVNKGDQIIAYIKKGSEVEPIIQEKQEILVKEDVEVKPEKDFSKSNFSSKHKNIKGKFSLSGYSNLSNDNYSTDYQSWRYTFSLDANRINGSRFSFSNYITFKYRADEWNEVTNDIGKYLKVYDLAVDYHYNIKTKFTLGRKINRKVSNIGAIDGLQFESILNSFTVGAIVGLRPDYSDYGFNSSLLQLGGYVSRNDSLGNGTTQNTVSVFQQMNNSTTDRRFAYFQHSNNIIKNVNIFVSTEIDLFKKENDKNINDFRLTSFYLSTRYSPLRWLSASASYDARKNVIYYETFKNYADQLIEDALRQGLRFRINLRPIKYSFLSFYTGYKFRDADIEPSRNFGASFTHSRIPYLNLSANVSYIKLNTSYLDGNIIGLRLSRDFLNGLLYGTFNYRKVDYTFVNSNSKLAQDIFGIDVSSRIGKSIALSLSFEGTYEKSASYSNIYLNITTRF